jgi:GTPase-associated protein 1, N-terminal domain type 2
VWAEQAVFTSLARRGREGYRLVSQSRGVGAADAQSLAQWAPSHGALYVDLSNRTSVNFHRVPSGRFAISRTCAGPPEYSGRGGRQLYTHILIVDHAVMNSAGFQPIAVFRAASALGYLVYQPDPEEVIEPVALSELHAVRDAAGWAHRAAELALPPLETLLRQLHSGERLRFAFSGNRIDLAECLIGLLPVEVAINTSFSTSLVPSTDRPFVLTLVEEISKNRQQQRDEIPAAFSSAGSLWK